MSEPSRAASRDTPPARPPPTTRNVTLDSEADVVDNLAIVQSLRSGATGTAVAGSPLDNQDQQRSQTVRCAGCEAKARRFGVQARCADCETRPQARYPESTEGRPAGARVSSNQAELDDDNARSEAERTNAKGKVQQQRPAKSQAQIDAMGITARIEAASAAKRARLRAEAQRDEVSTAQVAQQQNQDGQVTVESLKARLEDKLTADKRILEHDFELKKQELTLRLQTQTAQPYIQAQLPHASPVPSAHDAAAHGKHHDRVPAQGAPGVEEGAHGADLALVEATPSGALRGRGGVESAIDHRMVDPQRAVAPLTARDGKAAGRARTMHPDGAQVDPAHPLAPSPPAALVGAHASANATAAAAYQPLRDHAAPAPRPVAHAPGGGFARPVKTPELPPPPQTANQVAIDAFIDQARKDRDAGRAKVGEQRLAKFAQVTIDAHLIAAQTKAKNDQKLAQLRQEAERKKAQATQEAAAKKQDAPVTLALLTERLETTAATDKERLKSTFEAKQAELKARLGTQRETLKAETDKQIDNVKQQDAAHKRDLDWKAEKKRLEADSVKLVDQVRKQVAGDQAKLEKDKNALYAKANARIDKIEADGKRDADQVVADGETKAKKLEKEAWTAATDARQAAQRKAAQIRSAAQGKAASAADDAERQRITSEAETRAAAELAAGDKAGDDFDVMGKLDARAARDEAKEQSIKITDAWKRAKDDARKAADGQLDAIKDKLNSLKPLLDQRIKQAGDELQIKLAAGNAKLADSIKGSEQKVEQLRKDGEAKLAKLEGDADDKLQADYNAQVTAIDQRVAAARKQLAAGNDKNLQALERLVDQTCQTVDKSLADTEKKLDAVVAEADHKAQALVIDQLTKIKAEADRALKNIDDAFAAAMKLADDAIEALHQKLEDTARGKLLEIEIHTATLFDDLGDGSRLDTVKRQLAEYIKRGQKIPDGYGETAKSEPPSKKPDQAADKDKSKSEAGAGKEVAPDADAAARAKLLDPKNLSPEGIEAKVQEQLQKGQAATAAAGFEAAQQSVQDTYKAASKALEEVYQTKSGELDKIRTGDPEARKEARKEIEQYHHDQAEARKATEKVQQALQRDGVLGGVFGKAPDQKAIVHSLEGKTRPQIEAMRELLRARGIDLDDVINQQLSGTARQEAKIRLQGNPDLADIEALKLHGGHEMSGNEKGLLLGAVPGYGTLAALGVVNPDHQFGANDDRIREILLRHKNDPAFCEQFAKEAGRPLSQFLARTGNSQLGAEIGLPEDKPALGPEATKKAGKAEAQQALAQAEQAGRPVNTAAAEAAITNLHEALNGVHFDGKRADDVRAALARKSPAELAYIRAQYKAETGHDLDRDLEDRLSGPALVEAKATLAGDKTRAAVAKVFGAESASLTPFTVDDKKLQDTLRELTDPADRRAVLDAYKERTGSDLLDVIAAKMTGNDRKLAQALAEGDTLKARMVEADEAINGGFLNSMHQAIEERTGLPTQQFTRATVNSALGPFSFTIAGYEIQSGSIHKVDSDKLLDLLEQTPNPADRERLKALYKQQTHRDLDADVTSKLDATKLDAYRAVMDGRSDDASAARLESALEGVNDTKAFFHQLEGKSEAERQRVIAAYNRRHDNDPHAFDRLITDQLDGKLSSGLDAEKARLLAYGEDDAATGAVKLPDEFVLRYAQDSVWNRAAKTIDSATAVFDKYPALYAIAATNPLTAPLVQLKAASYFMRGWGVDDEAIKGVLRGKSKEDIDELKRKHPELEADLLYALSGRSAFEVKLMLQDGEPQTPKEKASRALALYEFDRGREGSWSSKISNSIVDLISPSGQMMDRRRDQLREQLALMKSGKFGPAQQRELDGALAAMDASTTGFLAARENVTGAMATAVGAIAGAVATAVTGGAAAAVIAALATGISSMAVKKVMLGDAYGRNDVGVDIAMMAVQVATAGVGGDAKTFLAKVMAGAVTNAITSAVSTAITSKDAHDLLSLLGQVAKSGLVGAMTGAAGAAAQHSIIGALEALSKRAFQANLFDKDGPLGALFLKGTLSGGAQSVATMLAEAAINPDTLSGNWDAVFSKLAGSFAQGALQGGLTDLAHGVSHRREAAAHARAAQQERAKAMLREAADAAKHKQAEGAPLGEQQQAFAQKLAEAAQVEAARQAEPSGQPPAEPSAIHDQTLAPEAAQRHGVAEVEGHEPRGAGPTAGDEHHPAQPGPHGEEAHQPSTASERAKTLKARMTEEQQEAARQQAREFGEALTRPGGPDIPGTEAMWVVPDHTETLSPGWVRESDARNLMKVAAMAERVPAVRELLDIIQARGGEITFLDRAGSALEEGNQIKLASGMSPEQMMGVLAHEAHHLNTFARDVSINAPDRASYERAALKNEAEAQVKLFEAHNQLLESTGQISGQHEFGADAYQAAMIDGEFAAMAENLLATPEQISAKQREYAVAALEHEFAIRGRPSTSYNEKGELIPGKPPTYKELYGEWFDRHSPNGADAAKARAEGRPFTPPSEELAEPAARHKPTPQGEPVDARQIPNEDQEKALEAEFETAGKEPPAASDEDQPVLDRRPRDPEHDPSPHHEAVAMGTKPGPETVQAFRAQGRPLLELDAAGNVAILRPQGRRRQGVALHVGFDSERARMWIREMGRGEVIEFTVTREFLEHLRATAQAEHGVIRDRTRPWRVDVDYPDQYAIPPALFEALEAAIIPGSGRRHADPSTLERP